MNDEIERQRKRKSAAKEVTTAMTKTWKNYK